ncbi:MAG: hypothetical protein AAB358_02455 [Patescibacteria group bacterium]
MSKINFKLNFDLKKIKINPLAFARRLTPISICLIVIILILFMGFLYRNVYQTLAQAETVTNLKKEVTEESLNKEKFYQVLEKINKKTASTQIDFSGLKNPFAPLAVVEEKKK